MPLWPCHNHPANYNLSWIFTKSRQGQCFIIIGNLHNAILCKYKDKEKSEKTTRFSTSYRENQDKYIYLAILLLDLSNIAIHGKNTTQYPLCMSNEIPANLYSMDSGVGGAIALTVALQLQNYWTKLTFVYWKVIKHRRLTLKIFLCAIR